MAEEENKVLSIKESIDAQKARDERYQLESRVDTATSMVTQLTATIISLDVVIADATQQRQEQQELFDALLATTNDELTADKLVEYQTAHRVSQTPPSKRKTLGDANGYVYHTGAQRWYALTETRRWGKTDHSQSRTTDDRGYYWADSSRPGGGIA